MKITIYELMGLIKDGKAPRKIKYGVEIYNYNNTDCRYYNEQYDDLIEKFNTEYNLEEFMYLKRIEILPEENDNWKDIKEINHNGKQIYNPKTSAYNTLNSKEKNIFIPVINQLINNQKYLKEKLESKDEK